MSTFKRPTRHTTCHFGDESLQAFHCTGTDNQKQGNKTVQYTRNTKHRQKKLVIANKTN